MKVIECGNNSKSSDFLQEKLRGNSTAAIISLYLDNTAWCGANCIYWTTDIVSIDIAATVLAHSKVTNACLPSSEKATVRAPHASAYNE
ncbi:hypothetical protein [Bartonella queenslandensis]|uniref:hypothetical protein n=1 Tax=Bartonella queenslandensis TaxID=481138 RepID=UPI0005845FC7|nr:hypothetical protein [Bartonella queenslandensis]